MSQSSKIPFSLETFLKRSWPVLVAGAVLALGIVGVLYSLVIGGKTRAIASSPNDVLVSAASTTESVLVARRLDGILVPPGEEALMPVAVMVENSPDARPLSGLASASVVVEAPVEGGITRFMAIFDATTTIDQVGPVRSARPYYVELADGLDAAYAHVGGSPDALAKISTLDGFRNLDEFSNGLYFWRSGSRVAPHNVYTKSDLLRVAFARKEWEAGSFTPWHFLSDIGTSTEQGDVTYVSVPYGGTFNAAWTYDSESNRYARKQGGFAQKDADGQAVSSSNVLVLKTEEQVLDDYGRLKIRTTGSGKGALFRDGKRFEITWRRTQGDWFRFESIEGGDVFFEPGSTWISLVTSDDMFPAATSSTQSP
jgi:hypothetical protein